MHAGSFLRPASLLLLAACGQTAALADKAKEPDQKPGPTLARPTVTEAIAEPANTGPLHHAKNLHRFFGALATLDEGKADDDVKVVVYGDSHTAADFETGAVRRALQARFGDGGRGFVYLGKPWRTYLQEGVKQPGMSREWAADLGKLDKTKPASDMCLGLGGVCLLTQQKARAWADITAVASRVEIDYWQQPGGGSFEVWIDGARAAKVATAASAPSSGFKALDVPEGPHNIEVRAAGDGAVRFFGIALDRAQKGLVLDALGINGARVQTALAWNEAHMTEQLQHRKPDLVVLSYGTNESFDDIPTEQYERALVDLLGRVARAVPTASCLLMGPPDHAIETKDGWISSPRLIDVIAVQRRVAEAAGCAFFDQLEAMGGAGTALLWYAEPEPRMAKDRVHLTRSGYAQVGASFSTELLRAYGGYRAEKGLPPIEAPAPSLPMVDKRAPDDGPAHRAGNGAPMFQAIPM